MSIKILPADTWFSLCIRERSGWRCEKCNTQYEQGSRGLHNAHFQGRTSYATRFDPDNCFALCFGCHRFMDDHAGTFAEWFKDKRTVYTYDAVLEKSNNIMLAKEIRHELKEIAKHFEAQHERMMEQRAIGVTGWLDFEGWK